VNRAGSSTPPTQTRAAPAAATGTAIGPPEPTGPRHGVDLYWLPLGAGGHSVRVNGVVYEALVARIQRRRACDLYHSALEVRAPDGAVRDRDDAGTRG
jgi:hypothetical protein